jgi:hypothetical protein
MKRGLYVALMLAGVALPGFAKDQWPGQSDFSNLNGPVKNTDNFGQVPIADFRFNPQAVKPWRLPASRTTETTLTPAEYSYCRHYQNEFPVRDISCAGPNLP